MNEPINDDSEIDFLLEEMLGGVCPPDLKQMILGRYHQLADTGERVSSKENGNLQMAPLRCEGNLRTNSPVATSFLRDQGKSGQRQMRRSYRWEVLALVAAVFLGVLGSMVFWKRPREPGLEQITGPVAPDASTVPLTSPSKDREQGETSAERKAILLPSNPFASEQSMLSNAVASENTVVPMPLEAVSAMDVSQLQFARMWSKHGVTPEPQISFEVWLDRVGFVMLGRPLTESEKPHLVDWRETEPLLAWLQELGKGPDASKHWGHLLAEGWLPRAIALEKRVALAAWIADRLQAQKGIAEIQLRLWGNHEKTSDPSDRMASELFLTSWLDCGDEALTQHFSKVVLGSNLVCGRCHDVMAYSQTDYWGLVALVSTLDQKVVAGNEVAIQVGDPKDLFFERLDRTMGSVGPSLSFAKHPEDVRDWNQLVEWMEGSPLRSRASINQIWNSILGSPLVPAYRLADEEGALERREYLEFLASQWEMQNEQLPVVLSWILLSPPLTRDQLSYREEEFLLASSEELQAKRLSDRLFGGYSSRTAKPFSNRSDPIVRLVESLTWDARKRQATPTLAQADIAHIPRNRSDLASTEKLHPTRFLWNRDRLPMGLEQQLSMWSHAGLDWDLLAMHGFASVQGSIPSMGYLERSRALLELENGDSNRAMHDLISLELGYD